MKLKTVIKLSVIVVIFLWPLKAWAFNLNLECPEAIISTSFDCDIVFVPGTETIQNLKADLDLTNINSYTFVNTNPTDVDIVSVTGNILDLNFLNNITEQKDIGRLRFTIEDPTESVMVTLNNILGNNTISAPAVTKTYNIGEPEPTDATLSSLTFTGYNLNFVSTTETYTLNIANATTLNFIYTVSSGTATVTVMQDDNIITTNSVTVNNNSVLKFTVTNGAATKVYTVNIVINTSTNPKTGIGMGGYIIIIIALTGLGTYLIIDRKNYGN